MTVSVSGAAPGRLAQILYAYKLWRAQDDLLGKLDFPL